MEIVMKFDGMAFYENTRAARNRVTVCASLLREEVFLPETALKIYAVFTAKRASNAFRIDPPGRYGESTIAGVETYILSWTRKTLGTAYKKGFRYVRIEY